MAYASNFGELSHTIKNYGLYSKIKNETNLITLSLRTNLKTVSYFYFIFSI